MVAVVMEAEAVMVEGTAEGSAAVADMLAEDTEGTR